MLEFIRNYMWFGSIIYAVTLIVFAISMINRIFINERYDELVNDMRKTYQNPEALAAFGYLVWILLHLIPGLNACLVVYCTYKYLFKRKELDETF